jgi:glycosyltransferase involved in cell wall biosynthesis
MKLAIVTDAWYPQVNGVVTTLGRTAECIERLGHDVRVVSPDGHRTVACPTYPEIRLALFPRGRTTRMLEDFAPDAIHIATEGPLGLAARRICVGRGWRFTTSYHTQFPQYVRKRAPIPEAWSYAYLRHHHGAAARTMVATEHQRQDLLAHDFERVVIWSRGVDTEVFRPRGRDHLDGDRPNSIEKTVARPRSNAPGKRPRISFCPIWYLPRMFRHSRWPRPTPRILVRARDVFVVAARSIARAARRACRI